MEAVRQKHTISKADRQKYASLLILAEMVDNRRYFNILMDGEDSHIEHIFIDLNANGLVKVEGSQYVPTEKGHDALNKFMQCYFEFLKVYDLYAFVDLEAGEFAFETGYDLVDDEYEESIDDERWSDVRIAVVEFKKLDPTEILFMSFINEGRFDLESKGWQMDIVADLIWDEIEHVANNSINAEEINAEYEDALENIVKEGTRVMLETIQKIEAEEQEEEEQEEDGEEEYEVVTYVEVIEEDYHDYDYYYLYSDPYYCSPIFYDPYWY